MHSLLILNLTLLLMFRLCTIHCSTSSLLLLRSETDTKAFTTTELSPNHVLGLNAPYLLLFSYHISKKSGRSTSLKGGVLCMIFFLAFYPVTMNLHWIIYVQQWLSTRSRVKASQISTKFVKLNVK